MQTTHHTHPAPARFPGLGEPGEGGSGVCREATFLGPLLEQLVDPQKAQGRILVYLFLPFSCDLIFGPNTKAIWGLDSCQVKGQLSHPTCLHASL